MTKFATLAAAMIVSAATLAPIHAGAAPATAAAIGAPQMTPVPTGRALQCSRKPICHMVRGRKRCIIRTICA